MIVKERGIIRKELQEELQAVRVVDSYNVRNSKRFINSCKESGFANLNNGSTFQGEGSYVVLDFGKELCGGIRMVVEDSNGMAKWRLTFGESLMESFSSIGEKNATNDHSPRDFEVVTGKTSDSYFGQTGFRFVKVELITDAPVILQDIFAVSLLPEFDREAEITTNDALLNDIIKTAAYTLKLNFQNGYIWDGIKRDRMIWCGDLHPEIITSLYLFGDNDNIINSLSELRRQTEGKKWINHIPSYSA